MFRARIVTSLFAVIALSSACDDKNQKPTTTTSATQPTSTTVTGTTPTTVTPETPVMPKKGDPIVTFKAIGLLTPECVVHDDAKDVYLVSSINGKPTDVDNNGFISRLSPDGKVETLKWIEGGKNKVTLNAPKGIGLMGDNLYVADLDTVRIFDRNTGAPTGEVKIPGATFLNDVAVTADGHVLVSDSGMKAGPKGFDPTGSDAVWSIDKAKKASPLMKSKELGSPNGLFAGADNKTWVSTFGSGELYAIDDKGKRTDVKKLPKGSLDGIVMLPGGDLLVASWEANAIYRGKPGGEFTAVVENVKSPADIGYDNKRGRVLVPLFESDEVRAYEIK